MAQGEGWSHAAADEDDWEPFPTPENPAGQARFLSGPSDGPMVGLWRVTPEEAPNVMTVTAEQRETLYVLEGEVQIEVDGGPTLHLKPGDMAGFEVGTTTHWKILTPFKEMFVLS